MKNKILGWVASILGEWFVPIEDYRYVQSRRWLAEETAERLIYERRELLERIYSRGYKNFEYLAAEAAAEIRRIDDIEFPAVRLAFQVSIPHARFYSLLNPAEEIEQVKEYSISRLGEAFKEKLRNALFYEPQTPAKS